MSWEAKCLEQISLSATAFCRINDRSAAGPFARFGSTRRKSVRYWAGRSMSAAPQ